MPPKHPAHNTDFYTKYIKLFDAMPNAILTFGLHVKHFLSVNIDFLQHCENAFIFCFTTWYIGLLKIVLKKDHIDAGAMVTFLYIDTGHRMGMLWFVLQCIHQISIFHS